MKPRILTLDQFETLKAGGAVLEKDGFGEKVILLENRTYLKLFRRKRILSSALWYPYANRFLDNAKSLRLKKIECPEPIAFFKVPQIQRDVVHYRGVTGTSIRELNRNGLLSEEQKLRLRNFILELHNKGIFFRSLHSGNIIATNQGFALIDISDMKVYSKPLGRHAVARNLKHVKSDPLLREVIEFSLTL